jgi:hypothetical protein
MKKSSLFSLSLMLITTSFIFTFMLAPQATSAADFFRPKVEGAPSRRVGGGTRGAKTFPLLIVASPEKGGLTTSSTPTLYWSVSQAIDKAFVFTITETHSDNDSNNEPLLEAKLNKPQAGVNIIALSDYNVELQPDITYEWALSIIMAPEEPSANINAIGNIKFVKNAKNAWYDKFAAVSKALAKKPQDQALHAKYHVLLDSIGIKKGE